MKYVSAHLVGINVFAAIVPFTKSTNLNNLFVAWLLHKKICIDIKAIFLLIIIGNFFHILKSFLFFKNILFYILYSRE